MLPEKSQEYFISNQIELVSLILFIHWWTKVCWASAQGGTVFQDPLVCLLHTFLNKWGDLVTFSAMLLRLVPWSHTWPRQKVQWIVTIAWRMHVLLSSVQSVPFSSIIVIFFSFRKYIIEHLLCASCSSGHCGLHQWTKSHLFRADTSGPCGSWVARRESSSTTDARTYLEPSWAQSYDLSIRTESVIVSGSV